MPFIRQALIWWWQMNADFREYKWAPLVRFVTFINGSWSNSLFNNQLSFTNSWITHLLVVYTSRSWSCIFWTLHRSYVWDTSAILALRRDNLTSRCLYEYLPTKILPTYSVLIKKIKPDITKSFFLLPKDCLEEIAKSDNTALFYCLLSIFVWVLFHSYNYAHLC